MNRVRTLISRLSPCLRTGLPVPHRSSFARRDARTLVSVSYNRHPLCTTNIADRGYASNSSYNDNPVVKPSHAGDENHYAHSILESLEGYKNRMMPGQESVDGSEEIETILDGIKAEEFSSGDPENILAILKELSLLSDLAKKAMYRSEMFWELVGMVIDALPEMSNEHLISYMESFAQLGTWENVPGQYVPERGRLVLELRNQCAANAEHWSKDQLLFLMNFFCVFKTKIIPDEIYSKLESEVVSMTKEDVIQLLYYLSLVRNADPGLLLELENKLERILSECSDDELAVACLGFFKTQHMVRSPQITGDILDRLDRNNQTMDEMCIVSLMKCLTYTLSRDVGYQDGLRTGFRNIMKSIYPRLHDFDNRTCMQLFRLCHSLRMMDHNFIDAMCQRAAKSGLNHWRMKDLSFLLFRCASFQAMLSERDWFYGLFVEQLEGDRRRSEIMDFPRCLLQALTGLAYMEIFPADLINECLSPSFTKLLIGKSKVDPLRELFVLDQTVEIECPDYSGCRLPTDMIMELQNTPKFKKNSQLPHEKRHQSYRDEMLLDIQAQVDMLFSGSPVAELAFVLPHFQTADVVIEVDEDRNICDTPDWVDREQPRKGHKRLVLICAAPNVYNIYETDYGHSRKINGIHVMKRRQLQKAGYTVIEIPYFEWNRSNKDVYLKKLLRPFIKLDSLY